jgi:hypothetical protein
MSVPDAIAEGWFAVGVTPDRLDKALWRAWEYAKRVTGAD